MGLLVHSGGDNLDTVFRFRFLGVDVCGDTLVPQTPDIVANANRAAALMERIRTYKDGEEPEVCRGPKPQSEHGYIYMSDGTWIRGDMPVERWRELLDSLPRKVS